MAYNMNGGPPMPNGGMMGAPNNYGGYAEVNAFPQPQPPPQPQPNFYTNGIKPQIYTVRVTGVALVAAC